MIYSFNTEKCCNNYSLDRTLFSPKAFNDIRADSNVESFKDLLDVLSIWNETSVNNNSQSHRVCVLACVSEADVADVGYWELNDRESWLIALALLELFWFNEQPQRRIESAGLVHLENERTKLISPYSENCGQLQRLLVNRGWIEHRVSIIHLWPLHFKTFT